MPLFDFDRHDRLWGAFEDLSSKKRSRGELLAHGDVPFPPLGDASGDLFGVGCGGGAAAPAAAERRARVRALLLRWHPDKFGAAHKPLFGEAEFARVMESVTAVSQRINEARINEAKLFDTSGA